MKYNIGWGLTNSCNMNCQFCYSKEARLEHNECSISEWKSFIDSNYMYIDSINYGTGENTILDNFFIFVNYVREKFPSIKQSLTTNGFLYEKIKNNTYNYLAFKNSIDEVDVSLDFCNPEKHSLFRGQKKAYDWAINTLKICNNLNKLTTIVFVGFEETVQKENIDGLFKIAKDYNTLLRMNIYRPVSKIPQINQKHILSYESLINTLTYINNYYEIISLSDTLLGVVFAGKTNIKENTGVNSLRILPNGNIFPSTYLIDEKFKSIYSIKQGTVLNKIDFPEFRNSVIPKECKKCKYELLCRGGVYDRRFLWYDTLEERDPYCPLRLGKSFPDQYYKTSKISRVSVHDDYLPTLFFQNKKSNFNK